jgi:hypothetical protein
MNILRWIGLAPRKPRARKAVPAVRPTVKCLEGRDLPSVVPLPPTGVVATGTSASSIALTWNASTDPSVTGYDVYLRTWIHGFHGGGYYKYTQEASNLTTNSDTLTGLSPGTYTYLVTDVNSVGQSLYSYPATAETWVAPTVLYGGTYYKLSSGYEATGPASATVGLTTQLTFYVAGNPLTYSIISGPSTVSINPTSGVMTFKPAASDVGTVNVTYQASNALGSVSQTIQFNVAAASTLTKPTLSVTGLTATYNGQLQFASATAYGTDGVTPVSGTYEIAYNGSATNLTGLAGTYQVLVTFTSSDPNYNNATVLTHMTIAKAKPTFTGLTSPSVAVGATSTAISGYVSAAGASPVGDYVIITVNGVSEATPVSTGIGYFYATFDTSAFAAGKYSISYAFAGDSNFKIANGRSTLTVGAPMVTLNPTNVSAIAGNTVTFTAAATGSAPMTVQWQVSTDGGITWTDITGNASAQTTTLSFTATLSDKGHKYRAVFTNPFGTAITSYATLSVDD